MGTKCLLKAAFLLLIKLMLTVDPATAQESNSVVTGVVVTDKNESQLAGVTVRVKKVNAPDVFETSTDDKGVFIFKQLRPGTAYDFSFSYVGFTDAVLKSYRVVEGKNNSIIIKMRPADNQLNEVVVTALGIKREEKSLGFAAQSVTENAVKDARTNNWVNSLSGKVAGLNIQGTGSGPMGSSRITLRGENSLNLDNNQALIVIDGVPVSSKITGTGYKAHLAQDSPVDFGSDLSDINPDDIASITVLKGPGATALYGSRAAGGALIITTKSGSARKDKGLGITVNSTYSIDQINRWPDYQYEYGEGRTMAYYSYGDSPDGINTSTSVSAGRAWGPKFNGQQYFQYDPNTPDNRALQRTPWVADRNYIKDYFKTGNTITNSVSIEGGGDKGTVRLSVSQLKNNWIIDGTGYERMSAALSINQRISDKLRINGRVTYTNKKSDNLPSAGYNNQTLMYFLAIGTAPNISAAWFKPYWLPGLTGVQQRSPFNPGPDNPYLDIYENINRMNKHGIIGSLSATYEFSKKMELMIRSGLDMSFEFRSQQRPYSMTKFPKGSYREQNVFSYEINTDALFTYKDELNSNIKYSFSAGANAMKQLYNFAGMYADQLAQPGIYQISNSLNQAVADPLRTQKAINSLYASTQWSYLERVFLDITSRNDWSSTLPSNNNSFFYPSVSTSFLISDMVQLPRQISFAKMRLSWAQVGNDTRPYQTAKYYDPVYGNNFTNSSTLYNPDLKPEIISSYEAGLDLRLFRNRLSFDLAFYQNNSRNQIIAIPLDPTSGYSSALINAGLIESKGVELQLKGTPIVTRKFKWNMTLNWSRNRSYVKELANGVTSQIIYSHDGNVTIEARVGGRMGDLYGRGFQRSPDGQVVYNSTGLPATLDVNAKVWGNAFADWKAGLNNEFLFNHFRIGILFDYQHGGSMYSQSNHKYATLGKLTSTLPGRDNGIVGDGVVLGSDGKYTKNTVNVSASSYYENIYAINNAEMNVFDATYLKLREARIEYAIPDKALGRIGIRQASVAVYGRDIFNITAFPGFDPEGGNLNSGTLTPGVELMQFPSTRNIGINLTFKF
jgi:TonB-linked SusC/RagA family outer membrane protein